VPVIALDYYYLGSQQKDLDVVWAAINEQLKERINATITPHLIDWGEYVQKINLINASGEPLDIYFTSWGWTLKYSEEIRQGNLWAMDDALPVLCPKTWASMKKEIWDAARVKGKIYGVMNQQIFAIGNGIAHRKDLLEKYGRKAEDFKAYADLTDWARELKEKEPGLLAPIYSEKGHVVTSAGADFGWDNGGAPAGSVRYNDPNMKVSGYKEMWEPGADWRGEGHYCELLDGWYRAGYILPESMEQAEARAAFAQGKFAVISGHPIKPGGMAENKGLMGGVWDFEASKINPGLLTTSGIIATMSSVSVRSKDPERCMQYLEIINTDKDLYTTLCKGIEGKHWVWVDKARNLAGWPSGVTGDTSGYNPNTDWMFGCQFNAPYMEEASIGAWEETKRENDENPASNLVGFLFDVEPVSAEAAAIGAVHPEYGDLCAGRRSDIPGTVAEYWSKLDAAGYQKVADELQRQINAWAETR